MATLICMSVHDTVENKRTDFTRRTLLSLLYTVDFTKHRIAIYDNGSCEDTQIILRRFERDWEERRLPKEGLTIIRGKENIGTARSQNILWDLKKEDENIIKLDNDVVFHYGKTWVDEMEEVIQRAPMIAPLSLKRRDLEESVDNKISWYQSTLLQLPHERGQRWIIVELVHHAFGTVQMYSAAFIKVFGRLIQPGTYGLDDSLASARATALGYQPAFLPHIDIEHIDYGGTPYISWKEEEAGRGMEQFCQWRDELREGKRNPYYSGEGEWK